MIDFIHSNGMVSLRPLVALNLFFKSYWLVDRDTKKVGQVPMFDRPTCPALAFRKSASIH